MTRIEIEYSVPHGYRRRADDVKEQILEELGDAVDVELVEGDKMDFKVRVDGTEVYSKKQQGYDPSKILARVKAAAGVEAKAEAPQEG